MTSRHGKFIFYLIILLFALLVGFNIYRDKAIKEFFSNFEPAAITISTVKAEQKTWYPKLHAVGTISSQHGVDVNAEASGNVKAIHFSSGQYINKGQPLITIDDSVEQAQLKYNLAELELKKLNFQREDKLYKKGASPSSNLDKALANLKQAEANVEQTKAKIQQKHIVAPFSGKLGIRLINLGQFISPGETPVVSLQSLDPLFLEFFLPEQQLKKIHVNQAVYFKNSEYPSLIFVGKITAINSKVDIQTHNIKVQATIPNCPTAELTSPVKSTIVKANKIDDDERIMVQCSSNLNRSHNISNFSFIPGMFASVEVAQPTISNQLVLPASAIAYSLYGNSVYIVKQRPSKKDKTKVELYVQQVFVETGEQQGNAILIEKGVKPGDEVVNSGQLKLQNGTRVNINNAIKMPEVHNIDKLGQ